MINKKRLIALVVTVIMLFSTVAVLAACGNTFSINWDNYVQDSSKMAESDLTNKMPTSVNTISAIPGSAAVNTAYTYSCGLVIVQPSNSDYVHGYLLDSNTTFATNDSLVSLLPEQNGIGFIGTSANSQTLYDRKGEKIANGATVETAPASITVNGITKRYIEVTVTYSNMPGYTSYIEVNKDGTLGKYLSELPAEEMYPQVGENITRATQTLGDWLHISVLSLTDEEIEDATLTEITVYQTGRTVIFFNKGKQVSTFVMPINLGGLAYADGKLLYTTLTPVDAQAKSGFNYVDGDEKYNSQMFSYDIKRGKTKELSVDYVMVNDSSSALFNRKYNVFDLATVSAYRMVNGVAYSDSSTLDSLVINNKGAIGHSFLDNPYGMPICKIGKNYLAIGYGASTYEMVFNIITSRGKLVASLGRSLPEAILSDSLVVTVGDRIGTIDSNGEVKIPFKYTFEGEVYGHYAYVLDNDEKNMFKEMILDLNTGVAKNLYDMCKLSGGNGFDVFGYLMREGGSTVSSSGISWYLLDGTVVAKGTTNTELDVVETIINHKTYGFTAVETTGGTTQYLRFEF